MVGTASSGDKAAGRGPGCRGNWSVMVFCSGMYEVFCNVINRHGVTGAVLQTASLLIR